MNTATCLTPDQADELTNKHTAFRSFAELLDATMRTGYVPTLQDATVRSSRETNRIARNEEVAALADEYDRSMIRLGLDKRAWRGSK